MRKLYVELRSGLGNQLFQYAFAFRLAQESNREVVLSPAYFDGPIKYWLKKVLGREARQLRLPLLLSNPSGTKVQPESDVAGNPELLVLKEGDVSLDRVVAACRSDQDVLIKGYWQNPRLFLDFSEHLKQEFSPAFKLSSRYHEEAGMLTPSSVAIHVRRGDFLTNKAFGACTMSYYKEAVEYISSFVKNPRFLVFTNDRDWVESNLRIGFKFSIYSNNGINNTDIEEMFLMSRFTNLIIPNSTFSWWSAFLNQNQDARVVAPSSWFLNARLQEGASSLLLPSWKIIENTLQLGGE